MKKVALRYGITRIEKEVPESTTCDQLAEDSNIRAVLGFGDNVKFTHNGVQLPGDAYAPEFGSGELVFETAANSKAVIL